MRWATSNWGVSVTSESKVGASLYGVYLTCASLNALNIIWGQQDQVK